MRHIFKCEDIIIILCEFVLENKQKNYHAYLKGLLSLGYVSKTWKAVFTPLVHLQYSDCDMNKFSPLSRQFMFISRVTQARASLRTIRVTVCQAEGNILAALAQNCDLTKLEALQVHVFCGTRSMLNACLVNRNRELQGQGREGYAFLKRELNCNVFPSAFPAQEYLLRFFPMCGESLSSLTTVDLDLSYGSREILADELSLLANCSPNITSLSVNVRVDDCTVSAILNMKNLKCLTLALTFAKASGAENRIDMYPIAFHRLCKELPMLEHLKVCDCPSDTTQLFCVESNTLQTLFLYGRSYFYIYCPRLRELRTRFPYFFQVPGTRHERYSPLSSKCLVTICERSPQLRSLAMGDSNRMVLTPGDAPDMGRLRSLCNCDRCKEKLVGS